MCYCDIFKVSLKYFFIYGTVNLTFFTLHYITLHYITLHYIIISLTENCGGMYFKK